jgi:hypothetical protein
MVQPARPRLAPAGLMFWSGQCRKVNAFGVEIRWADLGTSGHILVKRLHKTSLKWYPCCVVVEVRQHFPKNSAVNHHTYIKCRKTGWIRLIYVWNEYGVDTTCFLIQTYTHTQLYNHVTTKLRIEWIRIINMKDLFSDRFQMLKRAKARWGLLNCSWLCQNAQHCTAVLWAQLFSFFFLAAVGAPASNGLYIALHSFLEASATRLRRPSLPVGHEGQDVRIYVLIFVFFWMSNDLNASKCMHLIHRHIPALCVVWRCFVGYCRMFLSVACCLCSTHTSCLIAVAIAHHSMYCPLFWLLMVSAFIAIFLVCLCIAGCPNIVRVLGLPTVQSHWGQFCHFIYCNYGI